MKTIISQEISNLIATLHHAHQDNERQFYYASSRENGQRRSIMPVTPFIFEFFLYNSIYQVNWDASLKQQRIVNHSTDDSETKQQRELEKFLRECVRPFPELITQSFKSVLSLTLEGEWTRIAPDSRISVEDGKRFFDKLRELQIKVGEVPPKINKDLFDIIGDCRYYLYLIRNNIFHGSKTLGQTFEENQKRRIEVYLLFLRCLTSLFFGVFVKRESA